MSYITGANGLKSTNKGPAASEKEETSLFSLTLYLQAL